MSQKQLQAACPVFPPVLLFHRHNHHRLHHTHNRGNTSYCQLVRCLGPICLKPNHHDDDHYHHWGLFFLPMITNILSVPKMRWNLHEKLKSCSKMIKSEAYLQRCIQAILNWQIDLEVSKSPSSLAPTKMWPVKKKQAEHKALVPHLVCNCIILFLNWLICWQSILATHRDDNSLWSTSSWTRHIQTSKW